MTTSIITNQFFVIKKRGKSNKFISPIDDNKTVHLTNLMNAQLFPFKEDAERFMRILNLSDEDYKIGITLI